MLEKIICLSTTLILALLTTIVVATGSGNHGNILGQEKRSIRSRIKIEVLIFSGRENPSWTLSEEESRTLFEMIAKLPSNIDVKFFDGLGYRGFQGTKLETQLNGSKESESDGPTEFQVYKGVVYDGKHYFNDSHRQVEKWILKSGKKHLDPEIYQTIWNEVSQ